VPAAADVVREFWRLIATNEFASVVRNASCVAARKPE